MKKLSKLLASFVLILFLTPSISSADIESAPITVSKATETVQSKICLQRLEEINTIDKSNLSFSEKRQLRKEVRSIERQLRDGDGGIYLSVGAIIIIILLLILLL